MHTTLAAASLSTDHILGSMGVGGAAFALTVVLVLGIRGKGKHKLSHEQAGVLGFVAGTLYVSAGQIWASAGSLTNAITGTISGPSGVFGNAGQGAVALAISAWFWLGKPRPGKGALQGIAAATVFGTAGGIWSIAPALVKTVLAHLGIA